MPVLVPDFTTLLVALQLENAGNGEGFWFAGLTGFGHQGLLRVYGAKCYASKVT